MARDVAVAAPPSEGGDSKKFGMMLGVFTPSILTILGVIMYQRLGSVVGEGGLAQALAIVGLAHVISITTGLSVASIATNHAVKTGGNYYIISRSLGLSIGGAIGLALYVALALGVSLYLIGFAEAFLGAGGPAFFPDKIDNIRLIGSVACAVIALITLFSTSIALKSQIPVMVFIGLSLISIFLGSPLDFDPSLAVDVGPPKDADKDFATIFAIFFPAVTGFTAGVGMSGDLKDPKRAIPIGTMAAILVGLVAYVALTLFIVKMAGVEQLQNDFDVLRKIARWPWLVTAGVAAATLSSALGSILGAPRTLQALAFDGIVPRFLGRGKGEPRIALLVTIVIAEAGILVGELDVVGAIISMFFLTCYGFLCLACGLERWASSDFRPSFKVPVWVSLLGAASCFMVMFQINALAMFGAIIIMMLLYFLLKRRQLVLGSGDTWGGVWSAVVRMGLMRLRQTKRESKRGLIRNWRPNMMVLARKRTRRDLIDFGRTIVGDRGLLTHYDLVLGGAKRVVVDHALEDEYPGIFARSQGCENVYDAVPELAAHSGLAGMETNIIVVGWPQEERPNPGYAKMIGRLIELDISVLMLRFDTTRGFGKRDRIDIWWDGVQPTGQLMLTLAHLLLTSPEWKNARVRVLVPGRLGTDETLVQKRLDEVISDARVKAEGLLLSPLPDEGALADRIRQESIHTDLVMIHARDASDDRGFIAANDALIRPLGTALLVRPSTVFKEGHAVFDAEAVITAPISGEGILTLERPDNTTLAQVVVQVEGQLFQMLQRFAQTVQVPSTEEELALIQQLVAEVEEIRQLERRLARRGARRETARGLVDWARGRFGNAVALHVREFVALRDKRTEGVEETIFQTAWESRMQGGLTRLRQDLSALLAELDAFVAIPTSEADWAPNPGDPLWFRFLKSRVRLGLKIGMRLPDRRIPLRALAAHHLGPVLNLRLEPAFSKLGVRRFDALNRVRRLTSDVERYFQNLLAELDQSTEPALDVAHFRELVSRELAGLTDQAFGALHRFEKQSEDANVAVNAVLAQAGAHLVEDLVNPIVAHSGRPSHPGKTERLARKASDNLAQLPNLWRNQHEGIATALMLDVQVASLAVEARRSLQQVFHRIRREIEQGPLAAMKRAKETMSVVIELRERQEIEAEQKGSVDLPESTSERLPDSVPEKAVDKPNTSKEKDAAVQTAPSLARLVLEGDSEVGSKDGEVTLAPGAELVLGPGDNPIAKQDPKPASAQPASEDAPVIDPGYVPAESAPTNVASDPEPVFGAGLTSDPSFDLMLEPVFDPNFDPNSVSAHSPSESDLVLFEEPVLAPNPEPAKLKTSGHKRAPQDAPKPDAPKRAEKPKGTEKTKGTEKPEALAKTKSDKPARRAQSEPGRKPRDRSSSVIEKPADKAESSGEQIFKEAFLEAADELRGAWDEDYRPDVQELVDQLLLGLVRAAERVPESVSTMNEERLLEAAEGNPTRGGVGYPSRRLAQAFLEKAVVQPVRAALSDVPRRVRDAQSVLVDAVRLVTFELQQAAGASREESIDFDMDGSGTLALGTMLEEHIISLDTTRNSLESYLSDLRRSLLEEPVQSLDDARAAVTRGGAGLTQANPQGLGLSSERIAKEAKTALRTAVGQVGRAVDAVRSDGKALPGLVEGQIADDLLALRESLGQSPGVELPLIYRRIFGRAPLEASDLLRGREAQVAQLERIVGRWKGGGSGPIAIIGDPRSGRSSLGNIVARELLSGDASFRIAPPAGGTASPEALNEAVAKAVTAREGQSAQGALRSIPPGAVLIIDELGRWMERSPGGLAAVRLWIKLWRRLGERHLFLITATPYAWKYAEQLLGLSEGLLGTAFCAPLSLPALKDAILLRQRTSGFALEFGSPSKGAFDRAMNFSDAKQLRRLHERSRGNIGDALDLWRQQIIEVGERKITVVLGNEPELGALRRLPLKWYAGLASVALHRSLTAQRMARVMRIPREEATGLLSDLERGGLLAADRSGAFALDPTMQPYVLRALRQQGVLS